MSEARIVFGFHAVLSRIRQNPAGLQEIYVDKERSDARMKDLLALAKEKDLRVMQLERARLDGMAGNGRHQGVLAKVLDTPIPYMDVHDVLESLDEPPFLLVLDGVTTFVSRDTGGGDGSAVIHPRRQAKYFLRRIIMITEI